MFYRLQHHDDYHNRLHVDLRTAGFRHHPQVPSRSVFVHADTGNAKSVYEALLDEYEVRWLAAISQMNPCSRSPQGYNNQQRQSRLRRTRVCTKQRKTHPKLIHHNLFVPPLPSRNTETPSTQHPLSLSPLRFLHPNHARRLSEQHR